MVTLADKRAAIGAGWMALATIVMLGAGIVALATGVPLMVAGLFLVLGACCVLVTISLSLVALHGRGDEPAAADPAPGAEVPEPATVTAAPAGAAASTSAPTPAPAGARTPASASAPPGAPADGGTGPVDADGPADDVTASAD